MSETENTSQIDNNTNVVDTADAVVDQTTETAPETVDTTEGVAEEAGNVVSPGFTLVRVNARRINTVDDVRAVFAALDVVVQVTEQNRDAIEAAGSLFTEIDMVSLGASQAEED